MRTSDLSSILDPQAYLQRIRVSVALDLAAPQPSSRLLGALHQAHLLSVPFENLSIHYGQPIILEDKALYDKIVQRQRGGFCYELNGLFAWLLRQLGFTVTLLSARVAQADGDFSPEFDHLTLQVHDVNGMDWLADVGFGDSFRLPLQLKSDTEQDGGDDLTYRLRVDAEDASWLVQRQGGEDWETQYRFTLRPHIMADFAERCLFQQTSPDSHFTQFFFDETGDTTATSPENGNPVTGAGGAGGWTSIFELTQKDPSADSGKLSLFYEGNKSVAGLDNVAFLSRNLITFVEDAGDGLHAQRKALDSGYLFDVTKDYSQGAQPVRWLGEGRDPSATIDSAAGGFGKNDGDNEITGTEVSDGDTAVNGLLGAKNPHFFQDKDWRFFYTEQHGDNRTYEVVPAP
jgi:N-hydroxyarylamine O-acetyltransferase